MDPDGRKPDPDPAMPTGAGPDVPEPGMPAGADPASPEPATPNGADPAAPDPATSNGTDPADLDPATPAGADPANPDPATPTGADPAAPGETSVWQKIGNFFLDVLKLIGGLALMVVGAAIALASLAFAWVGCGLGFTTQFGWSTMMYGAFLFGSVFSDQWQADMDSIGWNPFNSDEAATTASKSISFYKGMPVHRTAGGRSGSFWGIYLAKGSDQDTLRHEWGHGVQQGILGWFAYLTQIGLPSATMYNKSEWGGYYHAPWELTADLFGGVTGRRYTTAETLRAKEYIGILSTPLTWITLPVLWIHTQ